MRRHRDDESLTLNEVNFPKFEQVYPSADSSIQLVLGYDVIPLDIPDDYSSYPSRVYSVGF